VVTVPLTMRNPDGSRLIQYAPLDDLYSGQINATGHAWQQSGFSAISTWNGESQPYRFDKSFRINLTRAREALEVVESDDLGLKRLALIGCPMQSNGVGRGLKGDVPREMASLIIKWKDFIWPNQFPYMEVGDGPGVNQVVGPLLVYAALIMEYSIKYDRVSIYCLGQGNTTLADHWGTDGTDGVYWSRLHDTEILGGSSTYNPPGLVRPSDDYLVVGDIGEADASQGTSAADYESQLVRQIGAVRGDMGSATYLGTILHGLSPTHRGQGTQAQHDAIIAAQQSFNDGYDPPTSTSGTVFTLDSEMRADDLIHRASPGIWSMVKRALYYAVDTLNQDLGIASTQLGYLQAGLLADGSAFSTIDSLADQFDFGT